METQLVIRSKPRHFEAGLSNHNSSLRLDGAGGRLTENVQGAKDALRYASPKQIKVVWSCRRLGVYP